MQLKSVVPFGRSLAEYQQMFALTPADLTGQILGAGDGPASFNAEATALGATVTSIDPIYDLPSTVIQARFDAVVDDIIEQVQQTPAEWVWSYHRSPADLRQNRTEALRLFLADYDRGKAAGRYLNQALPKLSFGDRTFELALCSHFLLLYSDHHSYDFTLASVLELLRVSQAVRIFPLLTLQCRRSPHLEPLLAHLQGAGYCPQIRRVPYELQKGGNEMLVISPSG